MITPSDENQIRRYLLGESSPSGREQIEERLFTDDEFAELLLLCEDELIDDYARNLLQANERELFEKNFSFSPKRHEKLLLAQAAVRYAAMSLERITESLNSAPQPTADLSDDSSGGVPQPNGSPQSESYFSDPQPKGFPQNERGTHTWWPKWLSPRLVTIYAAILIMAAISGYWVSTRWFGAQQKTVAWNVTEALNQAYRAERPFEARITGFNWAPFSTLVQLKGAESKSEKIDSTALQRAKYLLFDKEPDRSDPKYRQALGQYYMAQKQFDVAINELREGIKLAPQNARLYADLGAALLGKIELDRQSETGVKKEEVEECLFNLNKALEIEPNLPEAIFNRALLKQNEMLRREARVDWERYLQLDNNSSWAREARENLKQIDAELKKTSKKQEQRMKEFHAAYTAHNSEQILEAVSQSYTFNGNYIFEELLSAFLVARRSECKTTAAERLNALTHISDLIHSERGDRYFSDLVNYYKHANAEQIDLSDKARQLMREANYFYSQSENDRAVMIYEKAEELFLQADNQAESLFARAWIGQCHHQRSDTVRNLEAFDRVLPVCVQKKYRWMESNAKCGLANGHNSAGQFSQAIIDSRECGQIANELGDQIGVIRSQYMQGAFSYDLGKHEENLRLSLRGRKLVDKFSAEPRYAITFYNLSAWSLSALGFHHSAIAYQKEAVRMSEATSSPRLKAYAHIYQGQMYAQMKDYANAIASTQHGMAIGKELKDDGTSQDFQHRGLLQLGSIYREAGQFANSLKAFDQAKLYYEQNGKKAFYFSASKGRLLTLIKQGNDGAAQKELEQVISLYETYRQSIREESNRNSFFDQEQGVYDVATDFAFTRLNDPYLALTYAELGRARTLHDQLENGVDVIPGGEAPDLLLKPAKTNPRNSREILEQLPPEIQLLEYAVLNNKILIWVICKDGIRHHQIEISAKLLNEKIESFLALITHSPDKADERWREPASELYDILIDPIRLSINQQKPVYLIPDKQLARLPFGALVSKTQRELIRDFKIGYASSSNMFLDATNKARSLKPDKQEHLLAVGNPLFNRSLFPNLANLKVSEDEAAISATFYPSATVLVREKATKPVVLRELARADIAHLAMHYVPDEWSSMLSRLPLAPSQNDNGLLQMHELYRLNNSTHHSLPLRLVILSACQTRGEHFIGGEGAIGISRHFEAAGVPLIVASLWPVDAEASAKLMVKFHRMRKRSGQTALDALRTAQLEMLNDASAHRHPFFWAAFVSVGGYTQY
ncbi:MAG: CHAT domain-containing protein [Blastocatellales bacterium]